MLSEGESKYGLKNDDLVQLSPYFVTDISDLVNIFCELETTLVRNLCHVSLDITDIPYEVQDAFFEL